MPLGTLTGTYRVVKDTELRFNDKGTAIASARIVANRTKKLPDGSFENLATHWLTAKAFGPDAERLANEAVKGADIEIWGAPETEEWDDKDTGEKRSREVVVLRGFKVWPPRNAAPQQGFAQAAQTGYAQTSQVAGYGAPQMTAAGATQTGFYGAPADPIF